MLGRAIERGDWQGYWQAFIRLAYAAPEAGDVRLDALLPLINSASDWANPAESSYLKPETRLHATLAALEYLSTNGPADQRSEALLAAAWLVEGLEGEPEALPLWRRLAASYPGSAAAGTARSRVWQAENLQEGQLLPDVAWTDASGETFRLRMLRGVTVFYFWGSECTPCEAEIGHLKALSESWAGAVSLIGVNCDDDAMKFDTAVARLTPPGRLVRMAGLPESAKFQIAAVPFLIVAANETVVALAPESLEAAVEGARAVTAESHNK